MLIKVVAGAQSLFLTRVARVVREVNHVEMID